MKLVCVSTAAEWSARFLTIGPPRVKYSIAKKSLKALGFRRLFLLRSKSYGDTRSASKMPVKGFFDTLTPGVLKHAGGFVYADHRMSSGC